MAVAKKFKFLDLDNDDFIQEVSKPSARQTREKEDKELYLAKIESLKIEREFNEKKLIDQEKLQLIEQKNIKQIALEAYIDEETKKIKKIEKESKKTQEKFELREKLKEKLKNDYEKINQLAKSALELKQNYTQEKLKKNSQEFQYSQNTNESSLMDEPKPYLTNDSLRNMFEKVEKFEVKTNIYLRKDLYEKIIIIHNETGKSRSAIINKMIEIALKSI